MPRAQATCSSDEQRERSRPARGSPILGPCSTGDSQRRFSTWLLPKRAWNFSRNAPFRCPNFRSCSARSSSPWGAVSRPLGVDCVLQRAPRDGRAPVRNGPSGRGRSLKFFLASIPELTGLTREQRKRAWRYAFPRAVLHVVPLALLTCMGVSLALIQHLVRNATNSHLWSGAVSLIVAGVSGGVFGAYLAHRSRPHFRAFISGESRSREIAD